MIHYLIFLALHFVFCALFFAAVQRPLFMLYNRKINTEGLTAADLRTIWRKGVATDFIAAAYLTALPLLLLWFHYMLPVFILRPALIVCEVIVALIISLISVTDTALYNFWRFKIDSSVFVYLKSLKGAFASVSAAYIVTAVAAVLAVVAAVFAALYGLASLSGVMAAEHSIAGWGYLWGALAFILAAGVLFAFIRGIEHRPNTPVMVYYSTNAFFNHSALNPLYSMIYSFSVRDKFENQFRFFDDAECQEFVDGLFPRTGTPQTQLLRTRRPNIVLIIWESLCAHYVEVLGGKPGVTENFNRLSREGVLFTRVDAGSFRTDRGLVCILSGYLGQPTTSVIRNTKKLPSLPALPRRLKEVGYNTTVVHGGDLKIMHKNDYYIVTGHDRTVSIFDMPEDAPRCSWGVHDNYMFDWVYRDICSRTEADSPWLITFQTLSSHQPYKVPFNKLPHEISNAYAFTDDAFGRFVDRLKQTDKWDDLLIVVLGDHGLNVSDEPLSNALFPHIPILLLGGAVKQPAVIDTIMGQTDLAATLLGQMDLPHEEFTFSRDVLADTYTYPFSLNTYNNGFVFRDATGVTDYDNVSNTALEGADPDREHKGKMILQYLYKDLSNR